MRQLPQPFVRHSKKAANRQLWSNCGDATPGSKTTRTLALRAHDRELAAIATPAPKEGEATGMPNQIIDAVMARSIQADARGHSHLIRRRSWPVRLRGTEN
jgi:hypothetical protein